MFWHCENRKFSSAQNKKAVNALWDMYIPPQSVPRWTALFGGIHIRRGRCLLILAKGFTRASLQRISKGKVPRFFLYAYMGKMLTTK